MSNAEVIPAGEPTPTGGALALDSELMEAAAVLVSKADKYQLPIASEADASIIGEFRARLAQTASKLDAERLEQTQDLRDEVKRINDRYNARKGMLDIIVKRVDGLLKDYLDAKRIAREKALADQRAAAQKAEAERLAQIAAQEKAAAQAEEARQLAAEATTEEDRAAAAALVQEAQVSQALAVVGQQRAEAQADRLASAVVPAAAPTKVIGSRGSSSGLRDNWKYRLIDTPEQPAAVSIKLVPEAYLVAPEDRLNKAVLNATAKSFKDKQAIPGIEIYNDQIINSRTAS